MNFSLTIDQFKEMDALAIQNYALPIELMMENAGLQLARLVSLNANRNNNIWIGVGPGNNGDHLFRPDFILTMAAPKIELIKFGHDPGLFIADIGIPGDLYEHFGIRQPDFAKEGIVKFTNLPG